MSDIIHLLPDVVANQIAAGEVIQRPASVVKELVENAIDAGATHVDLLVEEAGRTSIQVIDDGKGMSETDARLAFERHATSKISKADDLFSLRTMGFRGEALPSIAAVAQVTLRTRMAGAELGTCLHIEGGKILSQEADGCPQGCNFLVQNLFFNVPVRRKFLKSNTTELNNVVQEFERMALVNPSVGFTFSNNGTLVTSLSPGTILQRVVGVFGKKMSAQLLPVDVDTTLCRISGFVGKPESARRKGAHQFFFVNGRYMRHPYFHKAVQEAFAGLIPESEQVPYFLYFEVDPSNIDVNIHPTKTEIKFENEQAIWQIVVAAVKEGLGKYNAVPVIDFNSEGQLADIPVYNPADEPAGVQAPVISNNPDYNPFVEGAASDERKRMSDEMMDEVLNATTAHSHPQHSFGDYGSSSAKANQRVSSSVAHSRVIPDFLLSPSTPDLPSQVEMELPLAGNDASTASLGLHSPSSGLLSPSGLPASPLDSLPSSSLDEASLYSDESLREMEKSQEHYQFQGQYILTSVKSGLMIVDQHRAHVRVLYNRYREQMQKHTAVMQGLLFPELMQLPASDAIVLSEMDEELKALGFDVTSLGGGSYSIQSVPAGVDGLDPVALVSDMVASVRELGKTAHEELQHKMALTLARNAAIPTGQVLTSKEMTTLLDDLFATDTPNYSPDGKTILAILPLENITKLFKN